MESVIFRFHCSPPSMFFMSDIKLLLLHPPPVSLSLSVGLCGGAVSSDQRDNKLSLQHTGVAKRISVYTDKYWQ